MRAHCTARLLRSASCIAIVALLFLQLRPLSQELVYYDASTATRPAGAAARNAEIADSGCWLLTCSQGSSAEPGLSPDADMVAVPPDMELVFWGSSLHRAAARCIIGQGILQLPAGITRLAQTEDGAWLVPDGALLRLPMAAATRSPTCGTSTTDAHGLLARTHTRCSLPSGSLLQDKGATQSSRLVRSRSISRSGNTTRTEVLITRAECAARLGGVHRKAKATKPPRTTGPELLMRRLSLPSADGNRRILLTATAAAPPVPIAKAANAPGALDAASLLALLRRPTAQNVTAEPPSAMTSAHWPTISALFPLPSGPEFTPAHREALEHFATQLNSLGDHERRDGGGDVHAEERPLLLLLASRALCDEPSTIIHFLSSHRNAMHVHIDPAPANAANASSVDPAPTLASPTTATTTQLTPYTPDIMRVWTVLAPTATRILADGISLLPDGALRARVRLLRHHPGCDAIFVPPGAALGTDGVHESDVKVEVVRQWQLFESAPPAVHSSAADTDATDTPPAEWLPRSSVRRARVPRGAWPVWHSTTLSAACRLGTPTASAAANAAARLATADGDQLDGTSQFAVAATAAAEVDYWLGCMQTGGVVCLARPAPPAALSGSADTTVGDDEPAASVIEDVRDEDDNTSSAAPTPEVSATAMPVASASRGHTLRSFADACGGSWVELAPRGVKGIALETILSRRHRLASLRVLLITDALPTSSVEQPGGGDVRAFQIASELAAEGHALTIAHSQPAAGGGAASGHAAALHDAGWHAFCPACNSASAVMCATCGEVQSATLVQCRLQAAARRRHRPAVVLQSPGGEAPSTRAVSAANYDVVILLVDSLSACTGQISVAELALFAFGDSESARERTCFIAVTDDIHWSRRSAESSNGGAAGADCLSAGDAFNKSAAIASSVAALRVRELDLYSRVDVTLTMTDEDRSVIGRLRPSLPLRTLPYALPTSPDALTRATFEQRVPQVLLVGSNRPLHRRLVRWMVRNVWPAVTERVPGATLQLAGSSMWYAEAKAARASGITGVSFIGEGAASVGDSAARQLTMALRTSRVLASPALAAPGGAPSFASLLAISHALPLVTTPIGARGLLASRSPGAVSIVKTALEFATAVAQLLTNSTAWTIQRNTAATHAQRHLGERAVVSTLRQSVASAASALHLGA